MFSPDSSSIRIALIDPEMIPAGLETEQIIYICKPRDGFNLDPGAIAYWAAYVGERMANGEAKLVCQPVVDLVTRKTVYHELLLRLLESPCKQVPTGAWIGHVAHLPELMKLIDRWVIQSAVSLAKPSKEYSINLSAHSIEESLCLFIQSVFRQASAHPEQFTFEITEQEALSIDRVHPVLEELKGMGFSLSLDDFGSDRSGFAYWHGLPVDTIKIDGRYIQEVHKDASAWAITYGLMAAAARFPRRISVVCEFVQSEEAIATLLQIREEVIAGCPEREFQLLGQGEYFGMPGDCC